ncbi:DUF1810 domain-containing protein [Sphingomonas sp. R1]|uniref:DUF1810 domain-containing protein n=1 Tax=Sphingomonas sp. R1 TaxID=399176 RepID=UPI0022259483|nr:DUF1810 domain-containing protein [Sphingomonas sp. R1]UYY76399.1 DUF1810 domain-containing protein [Sphingomonas sp. R1]
MNPLDRFVAAQARDYAVALAELQRGRKTSHWIWYIFPQIAGLGRSDMAQRYAIADLAEARAYLAHPLLGPRLREATTALLGHAGRHSAEAILGGIDAIKVRSSMTLFEAADGTAGSVFAACLDAFYAGSRDPETLRRITC